MCSTLKLLDTVSLQSNINANCALGASADNHYYITPEDGIYILKLCGMMHSISSSMSLKKLFITIPEYSPSANIDIDINLFLSDLPQSELYEAILNLDISEKVKDVIQVKQQPVQVKWSPVGLVANDHCAIASLTNRGSLDIFIHMINEVELEEYASFFNLTKDYIAYLKPSWTRVTGKASQQLQNFKDRIADVLPTAFEWSHFIKADHPFCYMFVAHLNGDITMWRIFQRAMNQVENSNARLISTYKTDLKRITALCWQQLGSNGFLLAGDINGKVIFLPVTDIAKESISVSDYVYLWDEIDNIQVEYFKVLRINGMTYILIIKGSFLLICLINHEGHVLDIKNFHAGNVQISGVEHLESNIVLVMTHTGIIKEVKLVVEDNKLRIDWKYIYVDFPWHLYRTHGLIVSPNKVFIAILVSMAKLNDVRTKKEHVKLLIFKNTSSEPLSILMKNSCDSLALYWDCLEILRLNGIVEKKLPCDGLPSGLNYDKLSTIQLKTCLCLAKSSETLYDKMYLLEEYNLLRSDELKHMLKIKLACKHMQHLFEMILDGRQLDEFHMQSLDIINMYLKEIVLDDVIPNLGLGQNTIATMYEAISAANELVYPAPPKCMLCNGDIIGTSCMPPHMDTRCSISFMQVVDIPYYKCSFCTSVVHWRLIEIYSSIRCPFCDIAMDLISVTGESTPLSKDITIPSCKADCSKEITDICDIEDHAFVSLTEQGEDINLIAVSSNDEDDEEEDSFHADVTINNT